MLSLSIFILSSTLFVSSTATSSSPVPLYYTSAKENLTSPLTYYVPCSRQYEISNLFDSTVPSSPYVPGCSPGNQGPVCGRYIVDNFLSPTEYTLLDPMINDKIFRLIDNHNDDHLPGPAIADINTGYIRSSGGKLYNMYRRKNASTPSLFTPDEYDMYRSIINRMRETLETTFHLRPDSLFFTAPTFITRTIGSRDWRPRMIHDEYYHPHVDKVNTDHYDYSALLYLSTYDDDDGEESIRPSETNKTFTGGKLAFLQVHPDYRQQHESSRSIATDSSSYVWQDHDTYELLMNPGNDTLDKFLTVPNVSSSLSSGFASSPMAPVWYEEHIMEPRYNRLVLFSSGFENIHQVQPVLSGNRIVLSLWFTCDKRRQFTNFLDGNMHDRFEGGSEKSSGRSTKTNPSSESSDTARAPPRTETLKEKEQRLKENRKKRNHHGSTTRSASRSTNDGNTETNHAKSNVHQDEL